MLYATQDSRPVSYIEHPSVVAARPSVNTPSVLPSTRQDMRPVVRIALETARLQRELSIQELSDTTGIDADTLRGYESGRAFPRADDIATLETHLEVKIAPR